jgi:Predicted hydrolase of the metallo-beta-lactamase superfamily
MTRPEQPRPESADLPAPTLEVIPLGGMGEIGKNITVFRYGDEIVVVDGGLAFPKAHQMGIDLIVPRID